MQGKLIFVTGGIKSGKSAFAEDLVSQLGQSVTYIATAQALDDEMENRIYLHRQRRPKTWRTIEEPLNVSSVISEYGAKSDVIMLDCLTMLVSNLMFKICGPDDVYQSKGHDDIINEIGFLAKTAKEAKANVVIVSNEVGMTLVSDNYLGRQYQELVGRANQVLARMADEAYLVVCGYGIDIKSGRG